MEQSLKKMNNKKVITLALAVLLAFTLTACGKQTKKSDSSKATTTSQSVKKASAKKSSTKKDKTMNLTQIKKGNYSSLAGDWTEIRSGRRGQYTDGGDAQLSISANKISDGQISMQGQTLTDNVGSHDLSFQTKNNVLTTLLKDSAPVATNWSVSFYPKGTTDNSKKQVGAVPNDQNVIIIWTSNNSYYEVFAQDSTSQATTATKSSSVTKKSLNLNQIAQNDFSSLVGTWKNETDGTTIVVTDKMMNKPAESPVASSKGVVVKVSGQADGDYPNVITTGSITNGYIQGGFGSFDPDSVGSGFEPLVIIPKNVKLFDADNSDSTRDRMIMGGGESGVKDQAYYRE